MNASPFKWLSDSHISKNDSGSMTCLVPSPTQPGASLSQETLKRLGFFDRLFHSREASVEMCEYDRFKWGGARVSAGGGVIHLTDPRMTPPSAYDAATFPLEWGRER
jgi:hypothetical protein